MGNWSLKESLKYDTDPKQHTTATTEENIRRFCPMVRDDRRFTINHKSNRTCISSEEVVNTLRNELSMTKVLDRWVPRPLMQVSKRNFLQNWK